MLAQALTSHARYIGMIGSKAKKAQVYAALRAQGVPDAELAAVCCPIGLPVAAETPQQIAVAIVAELLAVQAGTLQRLRLEEEGACRSAVAVIAFSPFDKRFSPCVPGRHNLTVA